MLKLHQKRHPFARTRNMQILVIQTAFLGDIILTTPFLKALKQKWPVSQIHVVTTPVGCEILDGIEGISLYALDKRSGNFYAGLKIIKKNLSSYTFDIVFSVHRSPRSLFLGRVLKARRRIAFRNFFSSILGYETIPYPPYTNENHYSSKPFHLLKIFGEMPLEIPKPTLVVKPPEGAQHVSWSSSKNYIVLSPFSRWKTKMWPFERYIELAKILKNTFSVPIVFVGEHFKNNHERNLIEQLAGGFAGACTAGLSAGSASDNVRIISMIGKTNIKELKAIIAEAKLLISNDSACVHLASAFDVPTVALFGPTVQKWGFFPLASKSTVIELENLYCRPCSLHGPQECPEKHFRCMNEISVQKVFSTIQQYITPGIMV